MCYFRNVTKINNMNEAQTMITRIILRRTEPFDYEDIACEIKTELNSLGLEAYEVNTFRMNNMIMNTLEQMVEMESLYSFNNMYIPKENGEKKRQTMYAFA